MLHYSYKILFKRLALLLAFYLLFRLAFYVFNQDTFAEATFAQTLLAFLHGFRFDLSALILINIPFIFLSIVPRTKLLQKPHYQKLLLVLYAFLNLPFFYLNTIDIDYYKFVGRRTTNELFTITQDVLDQIGHLALDYWYFVLSGVIIGFLLIIFYPAYKPTTAYEKRTAGRKVVGFLILIITCTLLIRGGLQYKPLSINHAFTREPSVLGNVTLNSTFTFMRSINNTALEKVNYFNSQAATAQTLGFDPYKYRMVSEPPLRHNVVIIILESFGSEYIGFENNGKGYTPFFDSLAAQGTFFRENYANGKRSIQALPSILSGLPALMDDSFIASSYESNQIFGLGSILKPAGYTTSFFHGAANGTMSFNAFIKQINIDKYYGLDEYPKADREKNYDGLWGIFDEPYLQYTIKELNRHKQPFASTIFTLSSHDPYTIPQEYEGHFPKGTLAVHETIGYTDHALRQFFKTAAQQPWYQNTLFILTGDHTQKTKNRAYNNSVGRHKVPLLLFHPSQSFDYINTHKITQHTDILPTIVDYLNIQTDKLLPFGQSVLDTASKGHALYYLEGVNTLLHQDYIINLSSDDKIKMYQYRTHGYQKLKKPVPKKQEIYTQELKAYLQYFRNGMVDNNLYYWIENKQLGARR